MEPLAIALNVILGLAAVFMIWFVTRSFSRSDKTRQTLGPWSVTVAVVSVVAGLALLAFVFFNFFEGVLSFATLGRANFFALFITMAQLALLLLPLVFLELPVTALLTVRVAIALIIVKLGEVIFTASALAYITLPVVLLIFIFSLRVDWGMGRIRKKSLPEDERQQYGNASVAPDDAAAVRNRKVAPTMFQDKYFPADSLGQNIESDGGASAQGANTVVNVSATTLIVTLIESILLALLGTGCSDAYLYGFMGVFAILHGLLCFRTLAPVSTFK